VGFAARPVGAQLPVPQICRALGFGKDKWQRIGRELRAVGALFSMPVICKETNRVYGQALGIRWPDAPEKPATKSGQKPAKVAEKSAREPAAPRAGKPASRPRKTDFPRAGFSGKEKPENPALSYKEHKIKEGEPPQNPPQNRQALAASLGLPVFDNVTGAWRSVAKIAEKEGGAHDNRIASH
jgi:hypothetical protein